MGKKGARFAGSVGDLWNPHIIQLVPLDTEASLAPVGPTRRERESERGREREREKFIDNQIDD